MSAFEPSDLKATVSVLAYNSGARGGLLVGVGGASLHAGKVPFRPGRTILVGDNRTPTALPVVLSAGQSVPLTVDMQLGLALEEARPGEARLRELIQRMEDLKTVALAISYGYVAAAQCYSAWATTAASATRPE